MSNKKQLNPSPEPEPDELSQFLNTVKHRVQLKEYNISYIKIGTGPTAIFSFPGLVGSIAVSFDNLSFLKKLHDAGDKYTFYIWDQPGYFESVPPERKYEHNTITKETEVAEEFLKYLGQEKYHICGFSGGGLIALFFAIRFPSLVDKIAVWSVPAVVEKEAYTWFRESNQEFVEKMVQMGCPKYLTHWQSWCDHIIKEYGAEKKEFLLKQYQTIKCPVLIIHGGRDMIVNKSTSQFLHENILGSKFILMPKAPHYI